MILATCTVGYLAIASLLPGSAGPDPYLGATEVQRYSFERDEDLDFDGLPDEWNRRKGTSFPQYVRSEIDRTESQHGHQSLRFDVNGGPAIDYSPLVEIDADHSYVLEGYVRTDSLVHDAALIGISLLNHKRQRVQRMLSVPVSGTHNGWVRLRIGPISPQDDVRFAVIGCYLVEGSDKDIQGHVWFDNLWLGKLPQLSIESNFHSHFVDRQAPVAIRCDISGIDDDSDYRLLVELLDSADAVLATTSRVLGDPPESESDSLPDETPLQRDETAEFEWELPAQEPGFYRVRARLERDGVPVLEQHTAFAVMELVERIHDSGEFGWSIARVDDALAARTLADVASQGGINWLKLPLWQSAHNANSTAAGEIGTLLDRLSQRSIRPIGLLSDPPATIRDKFARDWLGVSEIFMMPPEFWSPTLEPVIARYSTAVRHWQLGGEQDASFVGIAELPATLARVKREFDRIGRDTQIGVHWDWQQPLPSKGTMKDLFLSLNTTTPLPAAELSRHLQASGGGLRRWVYLEPLPRSSYSLEERATDLVQRMLAAKNAKAEGIFVGDVFDPEHGLLNRDGSPSELFLPWRTAALALQGAKCMGSFVMPQGSPNAVFIRDNEAIVVVWNEQDVVEEIYLGDDAYEIDIWGRRHPLPLELPSRQQSLQVGLMPKIIRGCSMPIALWRLAVQYQQGKLRSEYGGHQEAVLGKNTFPQGVSGDVSFHGPSSWEAEPNRWHLQVGVDEEFQLPMFLTLPPNASLGVEPTWIEFRLMADRPYQFRVHRPYQVGLGDVTLEVTDHRRPDGSLEIEQVIVNRTDPPETLNFRCNLFVPGQKRQTLTVIKLGAGEDRKFYFVPNGDSLYGKELWLRAEQIAGRRILNYRWKVGEQWDESQPDTSAQADSPDGLERR